MPYEVKVSGRGRGRRRERERETNANKVRTNRGMSGLVDRLFNDTVSTEEAKERRVRWETDNDKCFVLERGCPGLFQGIIPEFT
jgi:hypothetical protein